MMKTFNAANVKSIVVDLDRTLLHTDHTLSAYTVGVLKTCRRCGFRIMVATARPLRTTEKYRELIGFDAMVVSNGARIIFGNQQIDYGICSRSAESILNALGRYPQVRVTIETGDCAYSNHPIADYETILSDDLLGVVRNKGVLKILVHLDSREILELVQKELPQDLYYTLAHGYLLQIMDRNATKWNGIKTMLKFCNCSADETVYFGDDHDDIEPIKRCGMGVVVSNGIDEAKSVADYVTQSNDEDGVAKFIERRLLKRLQ